MGSSGGEEHCFGLLFDEGVAHEVLAFGTTSLLHAEVSWTELRSVFEVENAKCALHSATAFNTGDLDDFEQAILGIVVNVEVTPLSRREFTEETFQLGGEFKFSIVVYQELGRPVEDSYAALFRDFFDFVVHGVTAVR